MKNGNWIPISKNFINDLPKDRPYTKLEAAYCLQLDYDNNNEVTVSGCSDLWQWSRKKVYLFLDQMGIEIIYPEITQKIKNQRGHIGLHKRDIKGTYKGHIRLIDFSTLQTEKNIKGTYKGHKGDIKGSTTIDPISSILNPKEEKKTNKRKTFIPENYSLTEKHIKYAESKNITTGIEDMFEAFCINHRKRGTQFASWYAAWQTWVRNKIQWDKEKQGDNDDRFDFN